MVYARRVTLTQGHRTVKDTQLHPGRANTRVKNGTGHDKLTHYVLQTSDCNTV